VARKIGISEEIVQTPGEWKIGRGIALGNKYTVAGQGAAVVVKIFKESFVEVRHNSCEMGQGTHSCLAQMAAEQFGIPMERIRVVRGDTATTPYDAGSFSSRSIFHAGNALLKACDDAKRKMFAIAAPILGIPANELETNDFKIYRKSLHTPQISWDSLFIGGLPIAKEGSEIVGFGSYVSPIILDDENGHSERMCCYYAYTAFGVEVAVNEETGEIKILKCVGVSDMGQPINPSLCEVQIEGGMSMGVGLAMYEEMKFDNGLPLNPSFADYKVPTVFEIPIGENMESLLAWDPNEEGPFGAKGLGESTLSAIAPAIANAIYDAVGVRLYNQPLSRENVWQAIQQKKV
jgi:CO/xanthine dehydrogenase Mo-binding subunit